ncbi:uncharacterized protein L969DRAFT_42205, partial [Mixia osmundae IAM 14324]
PGKASHSTATMTGALDKVREALSPNRVGGRSRDVSRERDHHGSAAEEEGRGRAFHGGAGGHQHGALPDRLMSTGRGGAGNMARSKSPSVERRERAEDAREQQERSRSREARKGDIHTSGRGGAGNIRSPSRDPADRARAAEADKTETAHEADVKKMYEAEAAAHPHMHSAGRGGAGNVNQMRACPAATSSLQNRYQRFRRHRHIIHDL